MRGKIPKTELLVTFEVVARHESYTRAAEELALTQSAVFRQVSALEEFLRTPLFSHSKKRIFLNDAGKYYLGIVKETLNKLERDTNTIMTWQPTVQVIELAVNPTFSTHWLIPNLHEFTKLHPDIIVNIHSLANNGDFLNREYDAVIMRENFCAPWAEVEYLFDEEFCRYAAAVCLQCPIKNCQWQNCLLSYRFCIKAPVLLAGKSGLLYLALAVRWSITDHVSICFQC